MGSLNGALDIPFFEFKSGIAGSNILVLSGVRNLTSRALGCLGMSDPSSLRCLELGGSFGFSAPRPLIPAGVDAFSHNTYKGSPCELKFGEWFGEKAASGCCQASGKLNIG